MMCGSPPQGIARWSVRVIATEAVKRKPAPQVGRQTIRILLQNHELKPRRGKNGCIAELNEESIARMEDVLKICEKPLSERDPWSVWMRSLWCCTPMSACRGRCRWDGLPGVIRSTSGAARPTSSAVSNPRRGGTLPNQLRTTPRSSSPIT
jgi:hypothetical protein